MRNGHLTQGYFHKHKLAQSQWKKRCSFDHICKELLKLYASIFFRSAQTFPMQRINSNLQKRNQKAKNNTGECSSKRTKCLLWSKSNINEHMCILFYFRVILIIFLCIFISSTGFLPQNLLAATFMQIKLYSLHAFRCNTTSTES